MCDGAELGGGLGFRDAGGETADDGDPVEVAAVVVGQGVGELVDVAEGDPELGVEDLVDAVEGGGDDSDYGEGVAGDHDGLADDGGVSVEASLPEVVAEDDDGAVFFCFVETAPHHHGKLRDVEEVSGGGLAEDALGFAFIASADGGGEELEECGEAGEGFGLVAQVLVLGCGEAVAAGFALRDLVDDEEGGGVADGSGAEDEAVDHGEDGGVGRDADADGEDDGDDEGGSPGEPPEVVGKVLLPRCH